MEPKGTQIRQNGIRWFDGVYFAVIALITTVCFRLFGWMIIVYQDRYHSDIRYYVRSAADDSRPHWKRLIEFVFSKLHDLNGGTFEINLYLALVIAGVILANFLIMRFFLNDDGIHPPRQVLEACSIAALFLGPIYVPEFHQYFYRFSFDSFAWHSPTQQSMVFFSLIATFCFLKMFLYYEKGVRPVWWIASMIAVFLSTWSKPNFFMDLCATVVVLFLIEILVNGREGIVGRTARLFVMGCTLIPSGVYMIILNRVEYGSEESEDRVVFEFVNTFAQNHMKAGFLCGVAFALVVCAANLYLLKDRKYRFAAGIFITGILQWMLIHEEGPSAAYGNFSWGRDYGDYFILLISVTIALANWYDRTRLFGGRKIPRYIYFTIIAGLFLMHLISGTYYFYLILTGHGYNI